MYRLEIVTKSHVLDDDDNDDDSVTILIEKMPSKSNIIPCRYSQ